MDTKQSNDSRFPSTRLTVCKESAIVSHEDLIQYRTDNFVVNEGLVSLRTKDEIKGISADRWESHQTKGRCRRVCFDGDLVTLCTIGSDNDWRIAFHFPF